MSRFNNGKGYVSRRKVMWANSPLRRATLDLSGLGTLEEGMLRRPAPTEFAPDDTPVIGCDTDEEV